MPPRLYARRGAIPTTVDGDAERKGKRFFSEEKKQKTFISPPVPTCRPWPATSCSWKIKVFWFFSSEKNIFLAMFADKTNDARHYASAG